MLHQCWYWLIAETGGPETFPQIEDKTKLENKLNLHLPWPSAVELPAAVNSILTALG